MASISPYKNKSGEILSYKVTICLGRDDRYKQIRKSIRIPRPEGLTPTKERKEIQRLADAWEQEQRILFENTNDTSLIDKEKRKKTITLYEFIDEHWFADHVLDGSHSPSTVSFYEQMIEGIKRYFNPKIKLSQIDLEEVRRFIRYLHTDKASKQNKPYSPSSIQHYYKALSSILDYARRLHYIDFSPIQELKQSEKPHNPNKQIEFLESSEAKEFLLALEDEPLYWRCFMNVLITTGLRRGEAVGLQWSDISTDKLILTVSRNVTLDKNSENKIHIGETKGKAIRIVPLSSRVYSMLMQLKAEQCEKYGTIMLPRAYIFCRDNDPYLPCYPTEPTRWQSKFVKRHGLKNVSPHDLRHTAATLALESGADLKQIQQLLGHKDASTTMNFYTGVSEETQRKTVEGIESLII